MSKTKKIVLTVGLCLLIGLAVYFIINTIDNIFVYINEYNYVINSEEYYTTGLYQNFIDSIWKVFLRYSLLLIYLLTSIVLIICQALKVLKIKN